jgi:hypothetical protein
MTKRPQNKMPATVAVYADMLAMQAVLFGLINEIEQLHGSEFRPRLKRRVMKVIESFPDNAFAEGYEPDARAMAVDLVERLVGHPGGSLKIQ